MGSGRQRGGRAGDDNDNLLASAGVNEDAEDQQLSASLDEQSRIEPSNAEESLFCEAYALLARTRQIAAVHGVGNVTFEFICSMSAAVEQRLMRIVDCLMDIAKQRRVAGRVVPGAVMTTDVRAFLRDQSRSADEAAVAAALGSGAGAASASGEATAGADRTPADGDAARPVAAESGAAASSALKTVEGFVVRRRGPQLIGNSALRAAPPSSDEVEEANRLLQEMRVDALSPNDPRYSDFYHARSVVLRYHYCFAQAKLQEIADEYSNPATMPPSKQKDVLGLRANVKSIVDQAEMLFPKGEGGQVDAVLRRRELGNISLRDLVYLHEIDAVRNAALFRQQYAAYLPRDSSTS